MAPKTRSAAAAVASPAPASPVKKAEEENKYNGRTVQTATEFEFGGPIGVTALMIWSHYILIYFWYV